MKRSWILMLVLAMLAGCGQAEVPAETTIETAAAETETVSPSRDELPALDFAGDTVRIATWAEQDVAGELVSKELTGEIINDTVYNRNLQVQERLNVNMDVALLDGGDNYTVIKAVKTAILAGDGAYDITAAPTYTCAYPATEGIFRDLKKTEFLDLTKVYWSQGYNENLSVGNAQYICSGSPAISLYRYMYVTVYNNRIFAERNLDPPVTYVQEGTWTLEKQAQIAGELYVDTNGDGVQDDGDTYGFAGGARTNSDTYWNNCGVGLFRKGTDNFYEYAPDVERYSDTLDAILYLYYGCGGSYIVPKANDGVRESWIQDIFAEGRAAMATTHLYGIEFFLRDMEDEFTIVPMPKLNENQKTYRTTVQDQFTSYAINATVGENRLGEMGAFLECMGSESYATVFDAYYETALSKKYLQNTESVEMLHLIFDSVCIDAATIYTNELGGFIPAQRDMVAGKQNTVASKLASVSEGIQKKLETMNDLYRKLEE